MSDAGLPRHALDRPVWHALTGRQAHLAEGDGRALRLAPPIGPFAAAADGSAASLAALAALVPDDGELWLVEADDMPAPAGLVVVRRVPCLQMVSEAPATGSALPGIVPLGAGDADEMRALATLTRPGPFLAETHRLGGFVGVRDGGRLVAMAGERMKPGIFTELSGVCTHPTQRGKGLAGGLMRAVAARIVARGETPFLHCYPDNEGAIALYRTLGFEPRRMMTLTVLARG